jgi:hypothetical protein
MTTIFTLSPSRPSRHLDSVPLAHPVAGIIRKYQHKKDIKKLEGVLCNLMIRNFKPSPTGQK